MIIMLEKFGHLLSSRELGRESFRAFLPTLRQRKPDEPVIVDFTGVTTFSPSWGDEFFTALITETNGPIIMRHTGNASVQATLHLLREIHGSKIVMES